MKNAVPMVGLVIGGEIINLIRQTGAVAQVVLVILLIFSIMSWSVILTKWSAVRRARAQSWRFLLAFLCPSANRQGIYTGIVACILFTAWATLTLGEKRILDLGRFNFPWHDYMIGAIGNVSRASAPVSVITIESTAAKIGRSTKK